MDDCSDCAFSEIHFDDDDGEPLLKCQRYPRTVVVLEGELYALFPDADGRCGEYKPESPLHIKTKN